MNIFLLGFFFFWGGEAAASDKRRATECDGATREPWTESLHFTVINDGDDDDDKKKKKIKLTQFTFDCETIRHRFHFQIASSRPAVSSGLTSVDLDGRTVH